MGLGYFENVNEVGGHQMERYSDMMRVIASVRSFVIIVVMVV